MQYVVSTEGSVCWKGELLVEEVVVSVGKEDDRRKPDGGSNRFPAMGG